MRVEAERLVRQTERDLVNAGKDIEVEACELAAFPAHQAVEEHLETAWLIVRREGYEQMAARLS